MRLPFLKLFQNAWVRARTLASLLRGAFDSMGNQELLFKWAAMGLQVDLWQVALEMSPEEGPITGVFEDDDPASLLAAWLSWDGDPSALLSAFLRVHLVELRDGGFFVVGLPQYQEVLEERRRDTLRKQRDSLKKQFQRETNPDRREELQAELETVEGQLEDIQRRSKDVRRNSDGIPPETPPPGGSRRKSAGTPADSGGSPPTGAGRPVDSGSVPVGFRRNSGGNVVSGGIHPSDADADADGRSF